MKYPPDMPEFPRPNDHPSHLPWPPSLPEYSADSPARNSKISTSAFHRDEAAQSFGEDYILQLLSNQRDRDFMGDWWMLALISRCIKIAQAYDFVGQEEDRYSWLNNLTCMLQNRGLSIHLEGARFPHADLTGISLPSAILSHSVLEYCRLDRATISNANFQYAQLDYCNINDAISIGTDFSNALMNYSNLNNSDFSNSTFMHTIATHSVCKLADFTKSDLSDSDFSQSVMDCTNFGFASIYGAKLSHASCIQAKFQNSDLRESDLRGSVFTRSILSQAKMDRADVRGTSGILFDQNPSQRLHIDGDANDPWSVLRRQYTGPRFVLNLFLSSLFLLPYIIKVFQLNLLAEAYNLFNALAQSSEELPHVDIVRVWLDTFATGYGETNAAYAMLGGTQGWQFAAVSIMLILYNLIRYFLTVNVASLREAEDRSKITPSVPSLKCTCACRATDVSCVYAHGGHRHGWASGTQDRIDG